MTSANDTPVGLPQLGTIKERGWGLSESANIAGMPTRCGSRLLADTPPATADAPVVARLKQAGAVVVVKLHTHEFAYGPTGDVAATGPAHNPHDSRLITGGSSSGSAAAVAAGYLPLALGSDTGGSVRTPAALCGVVGLKPSFRKLPTQGVFPLSETCDHIGLISADVHGAAIGWDAIVDLCFPDEAPPVPKTGDALRGVVVGLLADDYWRAEDPVLSKGVADSMEKLSQRGARVVEVRTPMIEELAAAYPAIVGAEAYATHAPWLADRPGDYQPSTRLNLEPFAGQLAREYVEALRTRRRLSAALSRAVRDIDMLLLPTTRLRATPIGAPLVRADGHVIPVGDSLLALTLPFNLTGWPAITVPQPTVGLPGGVQLVGTRFDERQLLRVAAI